MEYITKIHALNLPNKLVTSGDWHRGAIQWENLHIKDSCDSIFGDYGIEKNRRVPFHEGRYNVANHIRAILDSLEDNELYNIQGMRENLIDNEGYTEEIFNLVYLLRASDNWDNIDRFMLSEYLFDWLYFKKRKQVKI